MALTMKELNVLLPVSQGEYSMKEIDTTSNKTLWKIRFCLIVFLLGILFGLHTVVFV